MAKTITVVGVVDDEFSGVCAKMQQALENGRLNGIFKPTSEMTRQLEARGRLAMTELAMVPQYIHETEPTMININGMYYYSAIVCHEPLEEHMAHEKAELGKY